MTPQERAKHDALAAELLTPYVEQYARVVAEYSIPPCPEGKHPGGKLTIVKHPLLEGNP